MISRDAAIDVCVQNFPAGPEKLAAYLQVAVAKSPLQGVEGWCLRGVNTLIRVNSTSTPFRQRFTLAHELAHLVLGTEPDIATEPFSSNSREEHDADQLASEFLIPDDELQRHLRGELPVDAKSLERLAKAANVSPVMAACRVVSSTKKLGLQNAAVVFFVDGRAKWRYSCGLKFTASEAERLMHVALKSKPNPVREPNNDGNIVIGSIIDAMVYRVLLIQLLSTDAAAKTTREERIRELALSIFANDQSFQQSVAACLGFVKNHCKGMSRDEATQFFNERYLGKKFTGGNEKKLRSTNGQEYVRQYLERWFA